MSASSSVEVTSGKKYRPKVGGSSYGFYAAIEVLCVAEYVNSRGDERRIAFVLGTEITNGKHAFSIDVEVVISEFIEVRPFFEVGKKYRFKDGREALIVAVHETVDGDRGALAEGEYSRGDTAGRKYVTYYEQYDFDHASEVE